MFYISRRTGIGRMNARLQRHVQIAVGEALKSTHPKARLGAIIFHKGVIIGKGYNQAKTHPLIKRWYPKYDFHMHAEMDAVIGARGEVAGCDIMVIRILKSGALACSKPCANCLAMLVAHRLRRLHYVDEDLQFYEEKI